MIQGYQLIMSRNMKREIYVVKNMNIITDNLVIGGNHQEHLGLRRDIHSPT